MKMGPLHQKQGTSSHLTGIKIASKNNGFADHIGIVESVSNGIIHTIEGNPNNQVRRNTYRIGHGNIPDLQPHLLSIIKGRGKEL